MKQNNTSYLQYKQYLKLMVSDENYQEIEKIVMDVAKENSIDTVTITSNLCFVFGVTYRIVLLLAKLAKKQGLTNFWLG
jgi:hypothetical protein